MKLSFKKIIGMMMATIAICVAFAGFAFAAEKRLTHDSVVANYGALNKEYCVPKDYVAPKYEDLTEEQKKVYDALQNREWYGVTFIDKNNKFLSLVDYWKLYGKKPVEDYIDYPTALFDDFYYFWICGDNVAMGIWQFEGTSTDFEIIYDEGDTKWVSKVRYDLEMDSLYIEDVGDSDGALKTVYYCDPDSYVDIAENAIIGSWAIECVCIDGKVASESEEKADGQNMAEFYEKSLTVMEFHEGGTVRTTSNGKLLSTGTYKFNKDNYIEVTTKDGKQVYCYDVEFDMLCTMPKNLDDNTWLIFNRMKYAGMENVTNEDIAGRWWVGMETFGQVFNSFNHYRKLSRYFGVDFISDGCGYVMQLNADGTGYYIMNEGDEKLPLTYTIEDYEGAKILKKITIKYADDGMEEEYCYNSIFDQIHYINGNKDIKDESVFCAYIRKDADNEINTENLMAKYKITRLSDLTPKEFTQVKYSSMSDAQKDVYEKIHNYEWDATTFLLDGKMISLAERYELEDAKPVEKYLKYPVIYFMGDKYYYMIGDYIEEYAWNFDGNTTDIIGYWEKDGQKGTTKMYYDAELDNIYKIYDGGNGNKLQEIYYKMEKDAVKTVKENIIGKWMITNLIIDDKNVSYNEYMKNTEDLEQIDAKDGLFLDINADKTVVLYNGEKVLSDGTWTWTVDDEAYIHTIDSKGEMTYVYVEDYDILVSLPKAVDDNRFISLSRASGNKFREATNDDIVGKWEMEYDTYGQDYNDYEYYKNMQKYFGVDTYVEKYDGYELCFNADGTGYYITDEGGEKYPFTYTIKDGFYVEVAYNDSDLVENYVYDARAGKICLNNTETNTCSIYKRK